MEPGASAQRVVRPSPEELYAAESAGRRAKKDAPVRFGFLAREQAGAGAELPPMAHLLRGGRGGRGGDVRFRLYLSLLWLVRDDATLSFPARAWAALLGLEDPETKGARRIKDALRWLDEAKLVRLERVPGRDSLVQVRSDLGDGAPYELPGAAYNRLRSDPNAARPHRYLRVPAAFWTHGWMSLLSGPAVAMLLVLLYETERSRTETIWLSPSMADNRYGLSEDTRTKGIRQLEQADLVDVHRQSVAADAFDFKKVRNVYELRRTVLDQDAQLDLAASREARRWARLGVTVNEGSQDEPFAPAGASQRRLRLATDPQTQRASPIRTDRLERHGATEEETT